MNDPDAEISDMVTYFFSDLLPDNPSHFISVQLHNGILDHNFLRHFAVYVTIEGCSRSQSETVGKKESDIMCVSGKGDEKEVSLTSSGGSRKRTGEGRRRQRTKIPRLGCPLHNE